MNTEQRLIRKFFKARFKIDPKYDKLYFDEWVYRFRVGSAWRCMDNETRATWLKVAGKHAFLAGDMEVKQ